MKGKGTILCPFVVLFLPLFLLQNLPAEFNRVTHDTGLKIQDNRASQGNPQPAIHNLSSTEIVDPKLKKAEFAQKTNKLQIPFIANNGQVDERVRFYANTFGGTVFVTKDGEIVYSLPNNSSDVETQCLASSMHSPNGIRDEVGMLHDYHVSDIMHPASWIVDHDKSEFQNPKSTSSDTKNPKSSNPKSAIQNLKLGVAIKETLVGGRVQEITGNEKAATNVSYFKGKDPSQWKTNIPTYEAVSLGEVYDGIELKLKAYGNNVEKLFCVKPGANPEQIKISLSGIQPSGNPPPLSPSVRGTGGCPPLAGAGGGLGARGLWINEHGELEVETELGPVKFTKPVAYQEINGKRVDVSVEYLIQKSELNPKSAIRNLSSTSTGGPKLEYGFTVASYDKTKDLIIDPLLASTYLGGSGYEEGRSLTLDTSGNVYVTGYTSSTDFPTTSGAYNTSSNGQEDVFVSKLNSGLTSLLASTYLGGSGGELGYSLTLDTSGNVYVTGLTASTDFPTTSGAYDTSFNGDAFDVFVSKLDSGLTSLLASTYMGGFSYDYAESITLDTSGNVYVAGYTSSSDFPTTSGAYDTSYNSGSDVFVSKLDGGLTSLLTSTYMGGSADDYGKSLALDTSGNVYVTGQTTSSDFPTTSGAYDTSFNGGYSDAFVSKLNSGLTSLLASTFLGGSSTDHGNSSTLDTSGNVYVTGYTYSTDFPTTSGAYDASANGNYDVFVSKLNGGLTGLLASTYLGGDDGDYGQSLTLDTSGNVYVTGQTGSTDFPTTSGAYDTSYYNSGNDVFVSKLNSGLTSLLASTYLSGSDTDWGVSLDLDTSGNVYVTGYTESTAFPTTSGAYDTSFNGSYDVFVSKLDGNLSASAATTPTPSPTPSTTPTPSPTTSPEEENLLEKYAPILYMHGQERFHPTNVKVMLDNSELYKKKMGDDKIVYENSDNTLTLDMLMKNKYNTKKHYLKLKKEAEEAAKDKDLYWYWKKEQTVYGRKFTSKEDKSKTVLQYWFFYVYNDWGTPLYSGNSHEGDWEMIQIILNNNNNDQPEKITYGFHHGGQTFDWDREEVSKSVDGNHPLVYVTLGGHGCWNTPGNNAWYQDLKKYGLEFGCRECIDETSDDGDILYPKIQATSDKYSYNLEDLSNASTSNWIYWKGYWGDQEVPQDIIITDFGSSGTPNPPYIDYLHKWYNITKKANPRWKFPIKWADFPRPSSYTVCASDNSKVIAHDIKGISVSYNEYCSTDSDRCGKQCSSIKIAYSEEDLQFDVYSLDGEEVTLKISRYNRDTKEVCEVEFDWLEIPKNGKATLRFSPEQNPNLEMEIDHDHNGIFDYRVSPDYATQNP